MQPMGTLLSSHQDSNYQARLGPFPSKQLWSVELSFLVVESVTVNLWG